MPRWRRHLMPPNWQPSHEEARQNHRNAISHTAFGVCNVGLWEDYSVTSLVAVWSTYLSVQTIVNHGLFNHNN
jgi:hypothetical protein